MPEVPASPLDDALVRRLVRVALEEDGASRDVTTQALVPPGQQGAATIIIKSDGLACGLPLAAAVFAVLDPSLRFQARATEGAAVAPGDAVACVEGALAPILNGERVALNFLQRLSGVATATRRLVEAVAGIDVRIVDTRKTTPGLRVLDRYAVRVGGGHSHRFNLSDGVLIKDNHLAAATARGLGIAEVIEQARRGAPHTLRVEVEVTTVAEAREALDTGADVVLLDNMSVEEMRRVVEEKGPDGPRRALIEASGGVTLERVHAIAQTGVDLISVGAITHSAPALDMSLEINERGELP